MVLQACEPGKIYQGIKGSTNYTCDGKKHIGLAFFGTSDSMGFIDLAKVRPPQPQRQLLAVPNIEQNILGDDSTTVYSSPTVFITSQPSGVALFISPQNSIEAIDFASGRDL